MLFAIARFFWRLLIVGFPPKPPEPPDPHACEHEFSPWSDPVFFEETWYEYEIAGIEPEKRKYAKQTRTCDKCNVFQEKVTQVCSN